MFASTSVTSPMNPSRTSWPRRIFYAVAILLGVLIVAALATASIWPVINDVETGKTPEYPDVQPQYYSTDPARVFDEARAAIVEMDRWKVVRSDQAQRTIHAERRSRIFGFVDDVTVRVEPATEFVTQVNVRSASRVGKGDFGQNARNIETFFRALDARLGAVRFTPDDDEKAPGEAGTPAKSRPDASTETSRSSGTHRGD